MHLLTLKLAVRGPSPMVWRRLRVVHTTLIADLRHIFQISMDWDDEYLHCFHIHGKDYGISFAGGGTVYDDDAKAIYLAQFGFDVEEVITLEKSAETTNCIGLTLAESKALLKTLQYTVIQHQAAAYTRDQRCCPHCQTQRRISGISRPNGDR